MHSLWEQSCLIGNVNMMLLWMSLAQAIKNEEYKAMLNKKFTD